MALMSPPMSLTRDTNLAQRTVTLFGGAREGETESSIVPVGCAGAVRICGTTWLDS